MRVDQRLKQAERILNDLKKDPTLLNNCLDLLQKQKTPQKAQEVQIPASIFSKKTTLLESIVKYLKENKHLNYSRIGQILNRDQRNIWQVYSSAKRKLHARFADDKKCRQIPTSIFADTKLSALEAITAFFREQKLTYHEIAVLTKRDDRTIWTVCRRYEKKRKNG